MSYTIVTFLVSMGICFWLVANMRLAFLFRPRTTPRGNVVTKINVVMLTIVLGLILSFFVSQIVLTLYDVILNMCGGV